MLFVLFNLSCQQSNQLAPIVAKDRSVFVHIPAGKYSVGSNLENSFSDERPDFWVTTNGFYIMETEVTNQKYADYLNSIELSTENTARFIGFRGFSVRPSEIAYTGKRYRASMGYEDHPIATVNYNGATAYCKWLGGRLPNEFEWEISAKGIHDNIQYAWGNEPDKTKGNVGKEWEFGRKMPTTPVKSYPPNYLGLYDMTGNVAEWTSSPYKGYPGANEVIFRSDQKVRMVVRGGDWNSNWEEARVFFRRNLNPQNRGFFEGALGFRCVMEAK